MTEIHTETVAYDANGTGLKGYVAHGAGGAARPGVLVVHEWWGLNDYVRSRVHQLAELGYVAFAVDMYGNGATADNPTDAAALMNGVLEEMTTTGTARIQAAADYLAGMAETDASRLGAIGYCFGGAVVLHGARIGMNLKGVVSFHGSLGSFHTPELGSVNAEILVCHGAEDVLVPEQDIVNFRKEMDVAGANYRFNAYEGALHGFTNPEATANGEKYGLPLAYSADVDAQSWSDMKTFFEELFA